MKAEQQSTSGRRQRDDMQSNLEKANKTSILIADDDAVSRLFCSQSLARPNALILTAECGKSAISMAAKYLPDIILMDAHLPDMNGMEAIAMVRCEWPDSCPAATFIGMTADDSTTAVRLMHQAGCRIVLIKPFSTPVLVNSIFGACQPGSGIQSFASAPHDHAAMRQLQAQFNCGLAGNLAELDLAITRLDWAEAQRLLHRLSGAAALAGLKDLAQNGLSFLRHIPPAGPARAVADSYMCFLQRLAAVTPP